MKRINPTLAYLLFVVAVMALFCVRGAYGQTAHTATYTITDATCTTALPCTAQIWRVALAAGSTCPVAGNAQYIQVQSALPGTTITTTGTKWNYVDSGASLVSGATYCGYATVTNGGGLSGASAIFQGTIPTPITPPVTPTIGVTLQ